MLNMKNSAALASDAFAIALSAAAQAAPAPTGSSGAAVASADMVHCYGVNSCKGMNACKGHGFKAMAAGQCLKRGGTIGDLGQ